MHELFDDLILLENKLWIICQKQNLPIYDFDFSRYFRTSRPLSPPKATVVARIGGFGDYPGHCQLLAKLGMSLIHTPDQHDRCSELQHWYPLLQDLTPKSIVFDNALAAKDQVQRITAELGWPIFLKGSRQTSRHKKSLAIVENPTRFFEALQAYENDGILEWQRIACRQFIPLRSVEEIEHQDRLPSSFEFRTFWWFGKLVGFGRYWYGGKDYAPNANERKSAVDIAEETARRLAVPFLVVDVAQTQAGKWIVVECNDAQESGYAGVGPIALWQNILDLLIETPLGV